MKKELSYFNIGKCFGGNQDWFWYDPMMKLGGCAAATACDLSIYLAMYKNKKKLCPLEAGQLDKKLSLIHIWGRKMNLQTEYLPFLIPVIIIELALMITALIHVIRHDHYKFGNRPIWIIEMCIRDRICTERVPLQ